MRSKRVWSIRNTWDRHRRSFPEPVDPASDKSVSRPVSRVLYGPGPCGTGTWRPFVLDGHCCPSHATNPDGWAGNRPEGRPSRRPYSVLLPAGFAVPLLSPGARWALTPPFHPCPAGKSVRAGPIGRRGGLLSVALSLRSPSPDVIRRRVSMEPGLSSPPANRPIRVELQAGRPPGRLTSRMWAIGAQNATRFDFFAMRPSLSKLVTSALSVACVERSATPSTSAGRKCRWNAAMVASVSASNTPVMAIP
jgi:hypothetical protein